jgi:YD repeat-containing protein
VLGQPWKVTQAGKLASETEYDAKVLPQRVYSFGALMATYAYSERGLLSTIIDPLGNVTTISNYHRGVPQRIEFADSTVVLPTVDDFGQVRAVRNQLGDITSYGYDSMGRMTRLDFPTADSIGWNPITRGFVLSAAAYGLPAGHWKQTVETGAARTTTLYDALWRPRLLLTEDTGNTLSKSFVVKRYDENSREIFSSYPVDSLVSVDDALPGARKAYDKLGRISFVSQDSELGPIITTSDYLTQFRTRITNPRQFQTTTSFQIFDVPTEQSPILIESPEGVTTIIERDPFGKPLKITRQGPAG